MNIEEFMGLAVPDRYDFSNDGASDEYNKLDSFIDAYEKFFVYMSKKTLSISIYKEGKAGVMECGAEYREKCKSKFGKIKDPDSESELLQDIYKRLWTDKKSLSYCESKENNTITGDTMNSMDTTLNKLYKYKPEEDCIETLKQKNERDDIKPIKHKRQDVSIAYIISRYAEDPSGQSELFDTVEDLRFFMSIYHTLGNFIPVPIACNAPRGTGKLKDYWDLTLKVIYDYYVYGEDKVKDIVGKDKDKYERYKNWLDSFKERQNDSLINWKCFIEKNYLQDFVNYNDTNGSYGIPKELWKGHFSGKVLPAEIGQIEQFYKNASSWITARSTRMLLRLRKLKA